MEIDIRNIKVIDLETTGYSPNIPKKYPEGTKNSIKSPLGSEIIEIGLTELNNLKIGKNYSRLIKPKKGVPSNITELTHITNNMLVNEKYLEDVLPNFRKFIGNSLVIGHNVTFDLRFLNYYLKLMNLPLITKYICTKDMLKKTTSYEGENCKLGTAVDYYGLKLLNAHRAYADTNATAQLFLKLLDVTGFKINNLIKTFE